MQILPNVLAPLLIIMTVDLGRAILLEATLSFLGVGLPANAPSLGTLIRIGMDYLFSGEWWILWLPTLFLVAMVISVNLLGDFLRDLQREFSLSLLFISHDRVVVRQMADSIAVMKSGRLVERAENDAFFAHPRRSTPASCCA